mgnify:CR=1 FL=1
MNMERLLQSVKDHEGYRNKVYLDTLGKRTVGVGHLCVEDFWEDDKEYEEKFLMTILEHDLETAIKGSKELMEEHGCVDIEVSRCLIRNGQNKLPTELTAWQIL